MRRRTTSGGQKLECVEVIPNFLGFASYNVINQDMNSYDIHLVG